ncbi:unnamed protein product, partial [Amoebophrya sp. A25]
ASAVTRQQLGRGQGASLPVNMLRGSKEAIGQAKTVVIHWLRRGYSFTKENPVIVVTVAVVLLVLVAFLWIWTAIFNALLSGTGTTILYLFLLVLFVRLVIRVIVFPGSTFLWRKKLESTYRAELALTYMDAIVQLEHCFVSLSGLTSGIPKRWNLEHAMTGYDLVFRLDQNFRMQRRDPEVTPLTPEQIQLETWLRR